MIVRLGVDASDFKKKMEQAGAVAASAGKRIKKELSSEILSRKVSNIMGWSGNPTGVGSITADNVGQAQSQLATLRSYRDQLADAGFDDLQFGMVSERIKELEYDLNEYQQSLNQAAESERTASRETDTLGNSARQAGSAVSKAARETEEMGQASRRSESFLSRAARALRSMGSSGSPLGSVSGFLRRIGSSAGQSTNGVEKLLRSIRNISVVSFAFRIAGGLFGEFQSIVHNYISQNAQLQAQVNGLSASLGQALAPAINLVVNALSYVLPYVVGVSNAIGQLLGSLFGSGWTAATKGAQQTAAATGGAAAAQKELNRQLMSFDEINKLNGNTDSSGAGGGGAGVAAAPIEAKTPAWLEQYKNAFTSLFSSAEFQASSAGGKIGMILNTAVLETSQLLDSINFAGIGSRLAGQFNDLIGQVDWSAAGTLLGQVFVALPDTIVGFIQNANWAEVGQSVTEFLSSSLSTVSEWIQSVDWVQIGQALKTFIANTDWGEITQNLGEAIGSAIGAVGRILWELVKEPWDNFINEWLENTEKAGGDIVAGLLISLVNGLVDIGTWLKENFCDPIVDGVKSAFGIHSPSTVFAEIGKNLMAGLSGGLEDESESVWDKLDKLKDGVFDAAEKLKSAFSFEWKLPSLKLPHLQVNWDPVDNVLANFFGVTAFPRLSVSWYARGGILDGAQIFGRMGNTLLGGGEAGREAVLPLDHNTDWMDQIAERVVSLLGFQSGGDVNVTIPVTLDGDVLTRVVADKLRQRARATGSSLW